jgi:GntR family transcriptional repressor for pyruvate dehydrogenase complex
MNGRNVEWYSSKIVRVPTPTESADDSVSADAAVLNLVPVEPVRAHEYVAEQLRHHIELGIIPVGSALPAERDLAQMLRVGRNTIQSALRILEAENLIETRRGRGGGTFVLEPRLEGASHERLLLELKLAGSELEDATRFRRIVEEGAAAEAARVADSDSVQALRSLISRMRATNDPLQFHHLDTEFHIAIATATGIQHLKQAVQQTRLILNKAIWAQPGTPMWHDRINNEHDKIVDAIYESDPVRAARAMGEHLAPTEAGVRVLIGTHT